MLICTFSLTAHCLAQRRWSTLNLIFDEKVKIYRQNCPRDAKVLVAEPPLAAKAVRNNVTQKYCHTGYISTSIDFSGVEANLHLGPYRPHCIMRTYLGLSMHPKLNFLYFTSVRALFFNKIPKTIYHCKANRL